MMMIGTFAGLSMLAPKVLFGPSTTVDPVALRQPRSIDDVLGWRRDGDRFRSRRRGSAGALAGLLALATFLLDYVARALEPAQSVAWLSPFRYYSPLDLIVGKALPAKNLMVLALR